MRVGIVGATGGVGRWLLAIARENGDHVKILARDAKKLPGDLGAIGVVEGDVLDPRTVAAAIGGCDVVFSAIGLGVGGPSTLHSQGIRNVVAAMRESGAKRLLAVSSVGVEYDPNASLIARAIIFPYFLKDVLRDMAAMEGEIVRSGFAYTIVRPVRLTDGPRTGLYRVNDRYAPRHGRDISRADVAEYMNRVVVDERTIGKVVSIAY